jgi:hypothetical protein
MSDEKRISCKGLSEYETRRKLERIGSIDRFFYSRNLPLNHRYVHFCFKEKKMANKFFEKEGQWKEQYGWLVEWRNKQKEESRAREKLKRKQKAERKEKKEEKRVEIKDETKQREEAKDVPEVKIATTVEPIPPKPVAEPSVDVSNHIVKSVIFESRPVTQVSEDFGSEWLNELNLEEDIDLALLDIHSLDSEETSEEIDFSNLDKLHENYQSQERMR